MHGYQIGSQFQGSSRCPEAEGALLRSSEDPRVCEKVMHSPERLSKGPPHPPIHEIEGFLEETYHDVYPQQGSLPNERSIVRCSLGYLQIEWWLHRAWVTAPRGFSNILGRRTGTFKIVAIAHESRFCSFLEEIA
jgi:hypothetical protein